MACASKALAVVYTLSGDFNETRDNLPHAFLAGQFYYLYDSTNTSKCRLRFDYNLDQKIVSNLYYFEYNATYGMSGTKCTAETTFVLPDPWWNCDKYNKTKTKVGDLYWYDRILPTISKDVQVRSILMSDTIDPTKGYSLKTIKFMDGRNVEFKNVKVNDIPQSSSKFSPDAGTSCPKPTCSMFTDILFVLDYSGSVSTTEWSQLAEFVVKVIESFTFGEHGAAAACIKFTTSASMLVPSSKTVTINKEDLIRTMNVTRRPSGGTCLGCGLELAMQVYDNSPRTSYNVKPNRIVIAVTDGSDGCKARTRTAAKNIKAEPYGAFFIGVGVGLTAGGTAEKFIKELTSTLGTEPAYFGVKDYAAIKKVAELLFNPVCDEFHSECGPECGGFCAVGECMCPTCEDTGSYCQNYTCKVQDGTSHGCEFKEAKYKINDTLCTQYECETVYNGAQRDIKWNEVHTCDEMAARYPGTCRSWSCNEKDGSCSLIRNHEHCSTKFDNYCEYWECADINDNVDDEETGCRVKVNKTQECVDKGKGGCIFTTCNMSDPEGGCIEEDTCPQFNTVCNYYVCENTTLEGNYKCMNYTVTSRPSDTACKTYACNVEAGGWYVAFQETPDTCKEKSNETSCRSFDCDDDIGCYSTVVEDCNEKCDDHMPTCVRNATELSSIKECHVGFCKVRAAGNSTEPYCLTNYTDCTKSKAADEARAINTAEPTEGQQRLCFTLTCTLGKCGIEQVPKPGEDNACYEYICVEDGEGGWKWEMQPTEVNRRCVTDPCTNRTCINATGCELTDNCQSKTNECYTYKCLKDKAGNALMCNVTSELIKNQKCREEICVNGKKQWKYLDLMQSCGYGGENNSDHCMLPVCNSKGQCEYYKKEEPDDDPCKVYTCDPETGDYSYVPKCDDGLYCTENKCTIDGECRYIPINCYLEVNMTNYPCFRAECVEQEDKYRCMRRLKPGVYIDVCGNCVRDGEVDESSESSMTMTACTEAPAEPLLKEGLAAASIAMIVLGAILIGGVITTSSVLGTKALLERAHAAEGQSAHSNPLFEGSSAEMTNPTFTEVDDS